MTFTVPNKLDATYPAQASLDSGDLTILAAGSGLTGVVSGCVVTAQGTPNMTVAVASGAVRSSGTRATVAGGNVTISAAHATLPRHDLITVDSLGALAAVAGTAAAYDPTGGTEPVFPAIPVGRVVLAAVYVPASTSAITAAMIWDKRVIVPDVSSGSGGVINVNYLMYSSGGTVYAVNGSTGAVDYSGADGGAILTSVLNALGAGGGTVGFKAGTYAWATIPALKPNTTGWVRLFAEPGATITLSTTAPRFLDFGRLAAGNTFNFIQIEGFTINAAALSATGSGHHMVIGTWQATSTLSGQDVNFDHIVIRRIRTINVRTAADATAQHFNIWIAIHATNNTTQYKLTNVLIEQCEFNGGNYGIGVYGTKQSGFTGADADIFQDNIVIRDIYHDTGTTPPGFGSFAHVHVGSGAKGGTCWIERVTGKNSWDVGVEVDNFETAYVNDCVFTNYNGFAVAITNFVTVPNLKAQTYYLNNITGNWTASGVWSSDSSSLVAVVQSNNGAGVPQTFGRVVARNLKVFRSGSSIDTNGIEGDLVAVKGPMIEFLLDGGQYQATGLTHTTGAPSPTVIYTTPASKTRVTLRNVDIRMDGTFGVASSGVGLAALLLTGSLDLLVDNVNVNLALTNVAAFSCHGIDLGAGTSNISGAIRNSRFTMNDTGGRGIVVFGTGNLTIPSRILIENCDFTGMVSGSADVLWIDNANKAKTLVRGAVWRVYPMAPYTITVPATTVAAQYIEGFDSTLLITGGTVTAVFLSRNNSTFYQVAAATNVAVPIQQGDYFRLTYSVAPTITVLPVN